MGETAIVPVLDSVVGDGEDGPLLSGDVDVAISSPPQSSLCGLDYGDNVVVPLDEGHGKRQGQGLA